MSGIVVTGASGSLGSELVRTLCTKGYQVSALVRGSTNRSLIPSVVRNIWVADFSSLKELHTMLENFCIVVHCAAQVDFYPKDISEIYKTNVKNTITLARAAIAAGILHFIYISSTEVTAPTDNVEVANESTPFNSCFDYGRSKILAEIELITLCHMSSMSFTIIRPSGILGVDDLNSAHQIFWAISNGLFFVYPGSKDIIQRKKTTFTHIDDVVQGIVLAIEKADSVAKNQIYILSANAMSYYDIINICARELGRIQPLFYLPMSFVLTIMCLLTPFTRYIFKTRFLFERKTMQQMQHNRIYSSQKAREELCWSPMYTMEEAIVNVIKKKIQSGVLKKYKYSMLLLAMGLFMIILLLKLVIVKILIWSISVIYW